jgi:DNA-binding NarL/FixJ family response regulator
MRVLIADDSSVVRERLVSMLSECPDVEIVGVAKNAREAVEAIQDRRPDVAILDIRMPGGGGIRVLQEVKRTYPDLKVIMLTNYPYSQFRKKCFDAGADFFFDKSSEFENLPRVLSNPTLASAKH